MNARLAKIADLLKFSLGDESGPLSRLLHARALTPVFQPIVSLADGAIHAHEALIRGPANMPLHSAEDLLSAARREGLLHDFELACVVFALQKWIALKQPGRLFINISSTALQRSFEGWSGSLLAEYVRSFGLEPNLIVFEITEHERVTDIGALLEVVDELHAAGMSFALDDFGDGRSSLRLWSELGPDVVKMDKYFVKDISRHAKKLRTVRALMQIAEALGASLVAEGVENEDDLRVLRDLGISLAQGYFLGRPHPMPRTQADPQALAVLDDQRVSVMPELRLASSSRRLSSGHIVQASPVSPTTSHDEVALLFDANGHWHAIAVVEEERPVALIGRQQFLDRYSKRYFKEIYGRKPCITFANTSPTLIDVGHDINDLIGVLTMQDQRYLTEGVVYTEGGRYYGLGTGHQLVRQVTESRVEAARHANPLTLLPGNIPISEHIDRLLAAGAEFVACYADLNCFKPFNDYYGYWRGDEVIKLLARTITQHCDARRDFVGHVGGDDFVVLFQSTDWERRCEQMVADFNAAAADLYDDDARARGGIQSEDRHGTSCFFTFTTLYMGVVAVSRRTALASAAAVASAAARARQVAKTHQLALYVDRDLRPRSDFAPLDAGG